MDPALQAGANTRDYAWIVVISHHRICFSGTSMTVCKDARIVIIKNILHHRGTESFEHVVLVCKVGICLVERPKTVIEVERLPINQ